MKRRQAKAEKFVARLQISRASGSREYIRLAVEDRTSGCMLLELEVGLEEFTRALTAQPMECEGTAFMGCPVNAKYEHRQIPIVMGKNRFADTQKRDQAAAAMLKPHEVDGWTGTPDDLWNGHRHVDGSNPPAQNVTFYRWVDAETGHPITE